MGAGAPLYPRGPGLQLKKPIYRSAPGIIVGMNQMFHFFTIFFLQLICVLLFILKKLVTPVSGPCVTGVIACAARRRPNRQRIYIIFFFLFMRLKYEICKKVSKNLELSKRQSLYWLCLLCCQENKILVEGVGEGAVGSRVGNEATNESILVS